MHRLVVKMFHFFIDLDLVRIALFSAKKWGVALYVMKTGLCVTWSTTQFLPQVHTANTNVSKYSPLIQNKFIKSLLSGQVFLYPQNHSGGGGAEHQKLLGSRWGGS